MVVHMSAMMGSPKVNPAVMPVVPQLPDSSIQAAGADAARAASAATGSNATIATGPQGLTQPANIGFKNLLGD